jgi:hypothetical protein
MYGVVFAGVVNLPITQLCFLFISFFITFIRRKSSLLCQSLDEKLEETLSDRFQDVLAAVEGLEVKNKEDRDHILGLVASLHLEVDGLCSQLNVLDMSLLDARQEIRERDVALKRSCVTNTGVFSKLYEQGKQLGKGKFGGCTKQK